MRFSCAVAISTMIACQHGRVDESTTAPKSSAPKSNAPQVAFEHQGEIGKGEAAPMLVVMRAELARAKAALAKGDDAPPYFISYRVTELDSIEIAASYGALDLSTHDRARVLDTEVRVGDHAFDNHHWHHRAMPGWGAGQRSARLEGERLPVEDDPAALTVELWSATDQTYRSAVAELAHAKTQQQLSAKKTDDSADFSKEAAAVAIEPRAVLELDRTAWEPKVRAWSAVFRDYPELQQSEVRLVAIAENRYFTSSEGAEVQSGRTHVRLMVSATTKAEDGMELMHAETLDVPVAGELPSDADVKKVIDALATTLQQLRVAPVAEPFSGPALLEGRAAAVYFHEVFGHRVEGHRQEDAHEGQTFVDKVGKSVMPTFLDVYDDPTIARIDGTFLNGHYRHDDEGVAAARTELVRDGSFVGFLMSRTPTKGFAKSNGHGRGQPGVSVVARQGNLVVAPEKGLPKAALDDELRDLVIAQDKPYGLRFVEISGGVTNTSRYMAQAFQVAPIVVFRVYPDGREELVRGVTLEGTPLSSLSKIVAAGDRYGVFNGYCGAESGIVPVSAASPALLLSQIEVARAPAAQDRPPLLPPPTMSKSKGGAR
jgi:predicted Zn-dependent protease